jgi:hypothetical protein
VAVLEAGVYPLRMLVGTPSQFLLATPWSDCATVCVPCL